ncbi:MAG: hypothetical protein FD174_1114 [Geobacteraceae bacterium]|nr:MAG: hypothetical protein FD174_1114 [Geobacteraceae bacterium]
MSITRLTLLSPLLLALAACSSLAVIGLECEKRTKEYNRMLRWQEFDNAAIVFVDKPLRDEFQKRIAAAKDVKVADYRVKSLECDPEKGEATVKAEFDYYIPPSMTLKTAEDVQKWVYSGENGKKEWRLKTLLPAFK